MFLTQQFQGQRDQLRKIIFFHDHYKIDCTQLQLIYNQTCLLHQISQQIKVRSKQKQETIPTQQSLDDQPRTLLCFSDRTNKFFKSSKSIRRQQPQWVKFNLDQNQLHQALLEVKQNCSQFTFQIVEKICLFKINETPRIRKFVEKEIKTNRQLQSKWVKMYQQNQNLRKELERIQNIFKDIQEQKKKLKKLQLSNIEKQKNFIKLQTLLINRQRIDKDSKKSIENHYKIIQQEKKNIIKLHQSVNHLLNFDSLQCIGKCWRQQLFINYKNYLIKQREILNDEEQQVKRHYQNTNFFVQQVIKSLNNKIGIN